MHIGELIRKSQGGEVLSREELVYLLSLAPDSAETYMVMAEATRLSKELSGGVTLQRKGKAERLNSNESNGIE